MSIDWSDVGKQVADVAPLLGTALGGPAGAALGALVAATLGTGGSPSAVSAAVHNDPNVVTKLRELEVKDNDSLRAHVAAMAQNAADVAKAEIADVQNARLSHKDHWMPAVLTIALVLMVGAVTTGMVFVSVPETNKDVLYLIVGQLLGTFVAAVTFWIGSSRSSADKNKLLSAK